MQTRDFLAEKVTLRGENPEMKPKSKSSSLIALGRRGGQRSAGQARGCAPGGAGTRRRSSPGTVAVTVSRGERWGGRADLSANAAPTDFLPRRFGGGGEDLQEPRFKSVEAGECEIGTKYKLAHWFVHLGF